MELKYIPLLDFNIINNMNMGLNSQLAIGNRNRLNIALEAQRVQDALWKATWTAFSEVPGLWKLAPQVLLQNGVSSVEELEWKEDKDLLDLGLMKIDLVFLKRYFKKRKEEKIKKEEDRIKKELEESEDVTIKDIPDEKNIEVNL